MNKKQIISLTLLSALIFTLISCAVDPPKTAQTTDNSQMSTSSPETTEVSEATNTPDTTNAPDTTQIPEPEGTGFLYSLSLSVESNPRLANDLSFTVDEDTRTATLELNYQSYADLATLSSAKLSAVTDGSDVHFTEATEDGSVDLTKNAICTVTDDKGYKKFYQLIVNREVYQLPIVNITLENGKSVSAIDRNLTTKMTFSLDCSGAPEYESVDVMSGTIRGRGNSTWLWEKKPYKIKLDEKQSLLGMEDNRDWILLANYADKSLIRNTLAYGLGRVLNNITWSPHAYPVDLFVNGKYRGVYSLGEHMEVASGRVDIEEGSKDPDTDFLLEIGGMDDGDVNGVHYFHTSGLLVRFATFKAPEPEEITAEQREFIKDYFERAEAAIIAGEGYEEYIDVDSFVDWIILHELSYNIDSCFRRSCYLTKEKGGRIKMGPVWDFDLAFGNFSKDNQSYNDWATVGSDAKDAYVQHNWCTYLMRDEEFCRRLSERWNEIHGELLRTSEEIINEYGALLDGSQQENYRVWQTWGIRAGYQSKQCAAANTYEKQLQYLRNFIKKRSDWIDNAIPRLVS